LHLLDIAVINDRIGGKGFMAILTLLILNVIFSV